MLKVACALVLGLGLLSGCNDESASTTSASATSSSVSAQSHGATLAWEAPTSNTNGTPLTNLTGYRIYYGSSANDLSQTVDIATTGMQTYMFDNLPSGTWYFAIMAVTGTGSESALSNVVAATIG